MKYDFSATVINVRLDRNEAQSHSSYQFSWIFHFDSVGPNPFSRFADKI